MATNSSIAVTEGSGKNIATYSISETSTKELQRVVHSDSTGAESGVAANPLQVSLANSGANATAVKVDGSAVTQPVSLTAITASVTPGTAAANLGKAEDAASASGDTGVFMLGIRRGSGAISSSPTSTTGDYQEFAQDDFGSMRTAYLAKTTNPTAASDGNSVVPLADKLGKQVVAGSIRDLKADAVVTLTTSTAETTLIAQVASTFLDVYGIIASNSSGSATELTFRDTTGGSARFYVYVPAGETRGFMLPESASWKQATVNTNWTVQSSASITSVKIAALYVKNI